MSYREKREKRSMDEWMKLPQTVKGYAARLEEEISERQDMLTLLHGKADFVRSFQRAQTEAEAFKTALWLLADLLDKNKDEDE